MNYNYSLQGTAADGQSWTTAGDIFGVEGADFAGMLETVMRLSFQQLTSGKAVYGKPGVGCRGPYQITRFVVTLAAQQ